MAPTICAICKEPANAKCTRCRSAVYCSRACQKIDFPLHKLLCSKIGTFVEEKPRPSDVHYLALLFHEKSNLPGLVWVEAEYIYDVGNVIEEFWHCSRGVKPYMSGCSGWYVNLPSTLFLYLGTISMMLFYHLVNHEKSECSHGHQIFCSTLY